MIRIMHDAPGVGLAAPQVGVVQRLLVYDVDDDPKVLVNPVLDEFSEETEEGDEGCLSVPGLRMPVERPVSVRVRAFDARRRAAGLPRRGLRGARHPARVRPPRGRAHRRPHLAQRRAPPPCACCASARTTAWSASAAAEVSEWGAGAASRRARPRPPVSAPRFAFAGTAPFAELVLARLLEAGRVPVGRGHQPRPPARPSRHAAAAAASRSWRAERGIAGAAAAARLRAGGRRRAARLRPGRARGVRLRADRRARRCWRRCRSSSPTRRWCRTGAAPRRWSAPSWPARRSWASPP